MTNAERFQRIALLAITTGLIPKSFRVGLKSDFWYHSAINWLLNLLYPKDKQDSYLKSYWTTIRNSIGGPDDKASGKYAVTPQTEEVRKYYKSDEAMKFEAWYTLMHELMHVLQCKTWTFPLYAFLYLFPMTLGGLLLITCWLPVFWASGWVLAAWIAGWVVLAGVCFIPQLPGSWRTHWELEAYAISMYCIKHRHGVVDSSYIDHRVKSFTSMMYYMMEPREKRIREKLTNIATEINAGTFKPNKRQAKVTDLLHQVNGE